MASVFAQLALHAVKSDGDGGGATQLVGPALAAAFSAAFYFRICRGVAPSEDRSDRSAASAGAAQTYKGKAGPLCSEGTQQPQPHAPPAVTLTYLDNKGTAEPIRLALVLGNVRFTDNRVTYGQAAALRASGKLGINGT